MRWFRWTATGSHRHSTDWWWCVFTFGTDDSPGTKRVSEIDLNQILSECFAPWNRAEFLFLEPRPWWAPSVQTELTRSSTTQVQGHFGRAMCEGGSTPEYLCQSTPTTRLIHEKVQSGPVTGIVMIVEEQMRDCLLLLGRLGRLGRAHPPVLVVVPDHFMALMPLLLESGSAAVMMQTKATDIRIADWCRRVAASDDSSVLPMHARTTPVR